MRLLKNINASCKVYSDIIANHLKMIMMFFVSLNLVVIISFGVIFNNYTHYLDAKINSEVIKEGVVDIEELCEITNCTNVYNITTGECYEANDIFQVKKIGIRSPSFIKISDHLSFSVDSGHLTLHNEKNNLFFALNIKKLIQDYISVMFIFVILSLVLFIFPLYKSIKQEQEEMLLILAGNEALLANKTMINITENIHHELNTPLEVLDNKVEKIHRLLKDYLTTRDTDYASARRKIDEQIEGIEEDFEFIKISSEQIYSVLEKMKEFKHLRYSNGNKNIKNIIEGGFKIINMSNNNFVYEVDNNLAKYKLVELKNADLLSIMLNHIKNSLEANASKILIVVSDYKEGKLKLRIIDNGNGIPEDAKNNIFEPNFSTKSVDGEIRGNGMYLNKHILKSGKGDVKVIRSSSQGTTIEISLEVVQKV
ncbi:MAG: sensor histidine kinase [Bacteroidales bacterium]|nr:sensor histidine kinase [Bacteroidales bacterium]